MGISKFIYSGFFLYLIMNFSGVKRYGLLLDFE